MPTKQSSKTNRFRCESCGRHFNTPQEFAEHRNQCAAALQSGAPHKPTGQPKEEGEDRDWVSVP